MFAASPAEAQPQPSEAPTEFEPPAKRPSGFWGTTQRAKGGAYRWKLLGIGVVLAQITFAPVALSRMMICASRLS